MKLEGRDESNNDADSLSEDRDTVPAIATLQVVSRNARADDKVLQGIVEEVKRTDV